jgi:hypothetical protein
MQKHRNFICTACDRVRQRNVYWENPEKARKRRRNHYWDNPEQGRATNRRYQQTPECRRKHRARWQAHVAVKKGVIAQQACENCGALKAEMHHGDYDQPLVVRWFCHRCHSNLHRRIDASQ